jgi:hypothetical protein
MVLSAEQAIFVSSMDLSSSRKEVTLCSASGEQRPRQYPLFVAVISFDQGIHLER